MYATKWSQERSEPCSRSFTTIAMHFAHAIAIVISRPLILTVIDRRVVLLNPVVTAILVGVDNRPFRWNRFGQNTVAARLVAMPDYPTALFARLATDDMNYRRPIVVIGPMSRLFIRAATGWIVRVAMRRTFFPRRSDRSHRPRTSGLPWCQLGRFH
jgi:hypothetical protein